MSLSIRTDEERRIARIALARYRVDPLREQGDDETAALLGRRIRPEGAIPIYTETERRVLVAALTTCKEDQLRHRPDQERTFDRFIQRAKRAPLDSTEG